MNRALLGITSKGLGHRLLIVLLLAGMAFMLLIWPGVAVMAGAAPEDEHEDIHLEGDGTEGIWQPMLWQVLEELEIIPIEDVAEGEMKDYLITGTNDFYINISRDIDGNWFKDGEIIVGADEPGQLIDNLMSALEQVYEFRMKIPDEVADKLGEGYSVGVAVADAKELRAGTDAEKLWDAGISKMPSAPQEARRFLGENRVKGLQLAATEIGVLVETD